MNKKLTFDKNVIVDEHEKLVKLLHDTSLLLNKEYKKQKKELKEYKASGINKIPIVMHEFKEGKLKTSYGQKVTNPKQAVAIALSEQKKSTKRGRHKKI